MLLGHNKNVVAFLARFVCIEKDKLQIIKFKGFRVSESLILFFFSLQSSLWVY